MLRFRITSAAYAMMLLLCYAIYFRPFGDALDAFAVLFGMFVLACVALWPQDSVELETTTETPGKSWAEKVDMPPREASRVGAAL